MKTLRVTLITILLLSTFIYAKAIGPNSFYNTIKTNKVVIVKFWAHWCPGCAMLKPEFEKAKRVAGKKVFFASYNVDLQGEPLSRYNIQSIPAMILFVNGKEVDRTTSMLNSNDIVSWVLGYVP